MTNRTSIRKWIFFRYKMSRGQLNIDLLGTSFAIQANETDEYLKQIYEHFLHTINQVKECSSVRDPLRLAIIAGILVTDELYKEQFKNADSSEELKSAFEIENSARKMIEDIDKVLNSVT